MSISPSPQRALNRLNSTLFQTSPHHRCLERMYEPRFFSSFFHFFHFFSHVCPSITPPSDLSLLFHRARMKRTSGRPQLCTGYSMIRQLQKIDRTRADLTTLRCGARHRRGLQRQARGGVSVQHSFVRDCLIIAEYPVRTIEVVHALIRVKRRPLTCDMYTRARDCSFKKSKQ